MPISFLEVPPGLRVEAKRKLVKEMCEAMDDAYHIPDTRIFIHEWPLENVSQDGRLDLQPAKPVCFLDVPPGIRDDAKRRMTKRLCAAITEAYGLKDVLILLRVYPLENVILDGLLQSENPMILEAMKKTAG